VNPYFTEWFAKEHRDDLLRAAETSRLAHSAEIKATNRIRWWSFLLRFRTRRHSARERSGLVGAGGRLRSVADIRRPVR
jgi:hypothetical protein